VLRPSKRKNKRVSIHTKRQGAGIILMMLCFVLAGSVYFVLAQPGITKVEETYCGFEAHIHGADCYKSVLHCGQSDDIKNNALHIAACYDMVSQFVSRNLFCNEQEILSCQCSEDECNCQFYSHTDGCYEDLYEDIQVQNCHSSCEPPRHIHTESCIELELICEIELHEHDETCVLMCEDYCMGDCWVCFSPSCCDYCVEGIVLCEEECGMTLCKNSVELFCRLIECAGANCEYEIMCCLECCAMGMLLSFSFSDRSCLNNYVFEKPTVLDQYNRVLPAEAVINKNHTYTLAISFRERANFQFAYNSDGYLVYDMPEGVKLPNISTPIPIPGANGKKIGEFTNYIVDSVKSETQLAIKFDKVDINGNPIAVNFIDFYINAVFSINIPFQFTDEGEIDFGMDLIIRVKFGSGHPILKKTQVLNWHDHTLTAYDIASINYTLTITADSGPVTINSIGNLAHGIAANNDTLEFWDGDVNLSDFTSLIVRVNGLIVPSSNYTIVANGKSQEIVFNPGHEVLLLEGQEMVVTYTLQLRNPLRKLFGDPHPGHFQFTTRDTSTVVYNQTLENPEGFTEDIFVNTWLSRQFLRKNGMIQTIPTNFIAWTIEVGNGSPVAEQRRLNLNGAVMTDTFDTGTSGVVWGADPAVTIRLFFDGAMMVPDFVVRPSDLPLAPEFGVFEFRDDGFTYTFPDPASPANSLPSNRIYNRAEIRYNTDDPNRVWGLPRRNTVNLLNATQAASVNATSPFTYIDAKVEFLSETTVRTTHTMRVAAGNRGMIVIIPMRALVNGNGLAAESAGHFIRMNGYINNVKLETDDPVLRDNYAWGFSAAGGAASNSEISFYFSGGTTMHPTSNPSRWPTNEEAEFVISYDLDLSAPFITNAAHPGRAATIGEHLKNVKNDRLTNTDHMIYTFVRPVRDGGQQLGSASGGAHWPLIYNVPFADGLVENKIVDGVPTFDLQFRWYGFHRETNHEYRRASNDYGAPGSGGINPMYTPGNDAIATIHFDPRLEYVPGSLRIMNSNTTLSSGMFPIQDSAMQLVDNTIIIDLASVMPLVTTPRDFEIRYSLRLKELTSEDVGTSIFFDNKVVFSDVKGNFSRTCGRSGDCGQANCCALCTRLIAPVEDLHCLNGRGCNANGCPNTFVRRYATGDFSNYRRIEWRPEIATKTMVQEANIAKFEVELNSFAMKIGTVEVAPGTNFVVVEDVMNENLALDMKSIKVEFKVGNDWILQPPKPGGGQQQNFPREPEKLTAPRPEYPYYYTLTGANKLTFYLPDLTAVRITYNAQIIGDPYETVRVMNELTINGHFKPKPVDQPVTLPPPNMWARASRGAFDLYKVDANDSSRGLRNAHFALYTAIEVPGTPSFTTSCGKTFYQAPTEKPLITDANGYVKVESSWLIPADTGVDEFADILYALVETKTPIGYEVTNGGIIFFSFAPQYDAAGKPILIERQLDGLPILIDGQPVLIGEQSIRQIICGIVVTNESMRATFDIPGQKIIRGNTTGIDIPEFEFRLMMVNNRGTMLFNQGLEGEHRNQLTVKLNPVTKQFEFVIPNLAIGKYYFIISELPDVIEHWTYDNNTYIVELTVSPGINETVPLVRTIRYRLIDEDDMKNLGVIRFDNDGKTWYTLGSNDRITFTNVYSAFKVMLPETGGKGRIGFLLLGLGLVVAGFVLGVYRYNLR